MCQHFSGNGSKSEPRHAARHCSECGYELYADEDFKCHDCGDAETGVEKRLKKCHEVNK